MFYFKLSVNSFTYSLEKIIFKYPKLSYELGFSHSIFFFSNKNRNFLQICKSPYGPILIFLITKFAIRKEINITKSIRFQFNSSILFLNNLNSSKKNLQIISTLIKQLFPDRLTNSTFLYKASDGILFDFDSLNSKIEVRIYRIFGFSTLIPRLLRKNNQKKQTNLSLNKTLSNLKIKGNKNVSLVRIIEIGPRFTLKIIHLFSDLNNKIIIDI